ncbi:Notchless protein 1 [Mortierella hygrophila]|uniref:Notchless protein 1 n=1 Tax=Mortierella hygrophila TaxID=979708 RepID=A0A9P6K6V7_9FUNG|nr:Notchless protein 1 [Mortierella hygrophila]
MSRKRNSYSPERDYTKRLCLGTSSLRLEDQMASPIELELQRLKIRCLQKVQSPANYIAPLGKDTMDATDSSASPLLATVMDFLEGDRKVLLVMGDGGSGKTYFLRQLERELWGKYAGSATDSIPILFDLSRVDIPKSELLRKVLMNEGINREHALTLKKNHRPFVLLCDGYDEAQVGGNIYNGNRFNSHGQGCVKLIIACRSQKLGSDFESQFQPEMDDRYNAKKLDQFQKVAMAPFTRSMIEEYVGKYIESPSQLEVHQDASQSSQSPPTWSVKQCMMALADIPNLMELVGNPFILSVVLRLLPTLTSAARDDTGSHVSFDALYKLVFENWMEVNKLRLYSYSRENMKDNEEAFSDLVEYDFAAECLRHMKDLAAEIFKNQRKDALSVRHTFKDPAKWKNRFFGSDARTRLLLESLPMTRSGKTYSFLFPSLLDYLYSLVVFDPEGSDEGNMDTDGSGTDGFDSEDSARSAEPLCSKSSSGQLSERGRTLQEQLEVERGQALKKGHALGFTNISERPMAVQFLADRVQIHQVFKEQLVETVHESANGEGNDKWLAANAMAILVKSGMRFNGADLRSIKIKGANLTGGEFDFADLRDADLRDVTFDKCWLRETRLDRAQLQGSKFGESPYTLLEDVPTASAYSPDGTLHAVTFDHRFIIVYYTSNWKSAFRSRDFPDAITSVVFSPDSKMLAFGDEFGVLRLWRYTATTIVTPLPSAHAAISDIAFSPDGSRIATAGQDGKVGIWDAGSGVCITYLGADGGRPFCVAFSPDGTQLGSGSSDGIIQLWNVDTGKLVSTLKAHNAAISRVLFSSDGHQIVSSSSDNTVRVGSPSTTTKQIVFRGHTAAVTGFVYLSDEQLASCSQDSTIRLWDTRSGGSGPVFRGHTDHVVSVAYSRKTMQLVSCGRDQTRRIWDCGAAVKGSILFGRTNTKSSGMYPYSIINDNTFRPTIPSSRRFFSSEMFDTKVTDIATSGDGLLAASVHTVGDTPTINIWLSASKAIVRALTGHSKDISCVIFSPDNKHIASGSADKTIRIWNAQSGATIKTLEGHDGKVTSIAYSPTGHYIVSGSNDGTVRLWDALTGDTVHSFDAEGCEVQCVAFSPSGSWIASGGEDGVVSLWDPINLIPGLVFDGGHSCTVNSIAFSADGIHIASGGDDNKVRIWNIVTGTEVQVLKGHMDPVRCLAFSSSGMRIFSGGDDRTVRVWNVATGTPVEALIESLAHMNSVDGLSISSVGAQLWTVSDGRVHAWTDYVFTGNQAAAASSTEFSRDCRQVAWSLGGDKLQLFSVDTGEPGLVLHGHSDDIECVSYSPKHDIIATASVDKTVRIWNSVQGGCLKVLRDQDVIFTSIVFSPDGRQIAMSCETRWCLLNFEPESLLKVGEQGDVLQEGIVGSVDHTVDVTSAPVYSPDGKEISVGAVDFSVLRYPTCSEVGSPAPLVGHNGIVTCIAYSPQLDKIATGSDDNTARIWDRHTGQQLFLQSVHSGGVTSIAFAPYDDKVATGDNEFVVRIWDWALPGSVRPLRGHDGPVLCVTYSPDGRFLASGSADRTMRLWDADSGVCFATVRDFAAGVESIRWKETQEGYRLATGSVENPLGIWELVEDKDENGSIRRHVRRCWGAGVHALAVSGAHIGQDHGLDDSDVTLLKQRNAVFTPPVLG